MFSNIQLKSTILETFVVGEAQCGYVILVIAVYWLTEALPIAVTSLLPIVLFPVVGVLPPKEVSSVYINVNRDVCSEMFSTSQINAM
ncbi:hypothetical protein KUTeg_009827 [Tegillarca granosa]|uniref:Uncharacterized protein n=1 Tax=Tegillarca granosa TaxID=220873 RepID=A0ABQ9F502_TEGGR|nr:hypothetical protein KUTeg_009827 [Tegillarca granosa]